MATPPHPAPFTSIVVPVRGDRDDAPTVAHAASLAADTGARLTLLSVVEPPPDLARLARAAGVTTEDIVARLTDARRQDVAALAEEVRATATPDVQIAVGKTFMEIIRAVSGHPDVLIVKTAERIPGLRPFIFASTDQHLLRKCPAAVWLRLPGRRRPIRSVLAAVDVDTASAGEPETQAALNRVIVTTAATVAAFENATLEVIHVWDAPGEDLVARWAPTDSDAKRYRRDIEDTNKRALHALTEAALRDAPRPPRTVQRLLQGAPREAIPNHVERTRAGVLVLGTIARTGVPGFFIGNTAEDLLNRVSCSVVTVKPPGYVSPIT